MIARSGCNQASVLCRIECSLGVAEVICWESMVMKESPVGRGQVMEGPESCSQTHRSPGQPLQCPAVFQDLKASRAPSS